MREDRLDSLLLTWQDERLQGREVPAAELCRDCPELAAELALRIEAMLQMHALMHAGENDDGAEHTIDLPAFDNRQTRMPEDDSRVTVASSPPRRPEPAPVPSVPGYDILAELGRGGMGVVYRATQCSLNRIVALKMMLAGSPAGTEATVRFLGEAEIIGRLQHPNVVAVHEFGSHEGKPYFTLEYLEGGTLAARLKGAPQPPVQAAQMVQTLAKAVSVAHAHGIVHRDLKPANVLLAADGTPKITDFGLAKQGDSGMTATGEVLGTPSYMAPEQAAGKTKVVGPAADIYGLGAILYEMLTGRPPFKGATVWDTVQMVVDAEPVAPSSLQARMPRDLETICLKCLQKEPHKRYASAADLAEDLRRFLNGEPIQARRIGTIERSTRWCRRNP